MFLSGASGALLLVGKLFFVCSGCSPPSGVLDSSPHHQDHLKLDLKLSFKKGWILSLIC